MTTQVWGQIVSRDEETQRKKIVVRPWSYNDYLYLGSLSERSTKTFYNLLAEGAVCEQTPLKSLYFKYLPVGLFFLCSIYVAVN